MKNKIFGLLAIVAFVLSIVVCLLDAFAWESAAAHPLLLLLGVLALSEGLLLVSMGLVNKSGFSMTVGGIVLALGALYFCLDFISPINVVATICIPLGLFVVIVSLAFLFAFKGAKIEFDNDGKNYKTYRERKQNDEDASR